MFVSFYNTTHQENLSPDFLEKVGNILLHCVVRSANGLYSIKKTPKCASIYFSHQTLTLCRRIFNMILCIIFGPLTLITTLLGLLAYKFSSTYQRSFREWVSYENTKIHTREKYRAQENSIIKLQKLWRGSLVRTHLINKASSLECKAWGKTLLAGKRYPRVPEGRSPVHIASQFPNLIVKCVGFQEAQRRWHNTFSIRKKLSHLDIHHVVIPRAKVHKNFLFEERLPIPLISLDSLCMYNAHPQAFDQAIKELLILFKNVHVRDLLIETRNPSDEFPLAIKAKDLWVFPRYDNLPLFLQKRPDNTFIGKIGIIDLEELFPSPHPCPVEELAVLFPLHKELLISEAKKLHIAFSQKRVEYAVCKGFAFHKHILGTHREFCLKKNITLRHNPSPNISLDSKRLSVKIFKLFNDLIEGKPFQGIQVQDQKEELLLREALKTQHKDKILALSKKVAAMLIFNISTKIHQSHNEEAKYVNSEGTLLMCRSPILRKESFFSNLVDFLSRELHLCSDIQAKILSLEFLHAIMIALVEAGELYDYDPMHSFFKGEYCRLKY